MPSLTALSQARVPPSRFESRPGELQCQEPICSTGSFPRHQCYTLHGVLRTGRFYFWHFWDANEQSSLALNDTCASRIEGVIGMCLSRVEKEGMLKFTSLLVSSRFVILKQNVHVLIESVTVPTSGRFDL